MPPFCAVCQLFTADKHFIVALAGKRNIIQNGIKVVAGILKMAHYWLTVDMMNALDVTLQTLRQSNCFLRGLTGDQVLSSPRFTSKA